MRTLFLMAAVMSLLLAAVGCDDDTTSQDSQPEPGCGNGTVDGTEECDGYDFGGATCKTLGYPEGVLICRSDCTIDTRMCSEPECGNGVREAGEACDGTDFGGDTCESMGYYGGKLTCTPSCEVNITQCNVAGRCGDGVLQSEYEECDGRKLGGATCESLGYHGGELTCDGSCHLNTAQCRQAGWCGDGIVQSEYEVCDGTSFGLFTVQCDGCRHLEAVYQFGSPDMERSLRGPHGARVALTGDGFVVALNTRAQIAEYTEYPPRASDIYIAKFDSDGSRVWEYQFGNGHEYMDRALTVDDAGNVYLGATIMSGSMFGLPIGGDNDVDALFLSFDKDGQVRWYQHMGTNRWDGVHANMFVKDGRLYAGAYTYGSWDATNMGGGDNVYMIMDTSNGEPMRITQFGTEKYEYPNAVAVSNMGYVYGLIQWNLDYSDVSDFHVYLRKWNPGLTSTIWTLSLADATDGIMYPINNLYINDAYAFEDVRLCTSIQSPYSTDGTPIFSRVVCVDGYGDEVWRRDFARPDEHFSIRDIAGRDGLLYVVGIVGTWSIGNKYDLYDDTYDTDGFLMVLDEETGQQLYYMEYPGNRAGTMFESVKVLSDGRLLIGGGTQEELQPGHAMGMWDGFMLVYDRLTWDASSN